MKKLVIIPGGFHPFHAGHKALYDSARAAFPSADIYVAATADTSTRPFPFELKKKLARIAGIAGHRFIQVKSPFRAEEITQHYDPANTQLIFVRSEKDQQSQPIPGGAKKDGTPGYLQPYKRNGAEPMNKHGYIAYLPTVQFGPGMTSATEIRAKWPAMTPEQKISLVHSMYPDTLQKQELGGVIVKMLDTVLDKSVEKAQEVDEASLVNDPEAGIQIRPTGGLGSWDEASLKSNLAKQLSELVEMLKAGNYRGVEHLLYKGGAVQSKVQALARLEDFNAKQGRRPIAKGREIDIGESDYIEEKSPPAI